MAPEPLTEQDWQIRSHLFAFLLANTRPPTYQETAQHFHLSDAEAQQAYRRLDANHRIFLDPGTDLIRMLHPFSAVPTDYQVTTGGRHYWANCAWDALGIPAALHADAQIEAVIPPRREHVVFGVRQGQLVGGDVGVIHFLLPFRQWYDDLVDT